MIDFQNGSVFKLKKADNSAAKDVEVLFIPGEEVISCYKGIRDYVVFTNKRAISVNVQGMTGKKKTLLHSHILKYRLFLWRRQAFWTWTVNWKSISVGLER